jgi:MinD superfamily P-loop ATPase
LAGVSAGVGVSAVVAAMPDSLRIAIASGKGGSGKTTVALHLAWAYARSGATVALYDCDVETPNLPCFLGEGGPAAACVAVEELRPRILAEHCQGCGRCVQACAFNALYLLRGCAHLAAELCHGCGLCARLCPSSGAITEQPEQIGDLSLQRIALGEHSCELIVGRTRIGSTRSPAVVAAALARQSPATIQLRDCAPGCACPTVAGLRGADLALLVAEASPFGLHDLKLAAELCRDMGLPVAVIVNRVSPRWPPLVQDWCAAQGLPLLAEIPDDRAVARAYADGRLAGASVPGYLDQFDRLRHNLDALVAGRCSA